MKGKSINEITVGDKASFQKTITETDVSLFAGITGDFNPLHINELMSNESRFKKRIAHGLLTAGLISTVLGLYLPGVGTIYLEQDLKFLAPVYLGDTITAEVEALEKDDKKNIIVFRTLCRNQENTIVIDGKANVMPPISS
jgi:3-hydroxybutyryl-CoA dehydratase